MTKFFRSPLLHEEISAEKLKELVFYLILCDDIIDAIFAKVYSWPINSSMMPVGQRLLREVVELHQSLHCYYGYTAGRQIPYSNGHSAINRCHGRLCEIMIDAHRLYRNMPQATRIETRQREVNLPPRETDTPAHAVEALAEQPAAEPSRSLIGQFFQKIKSGWQKIRNFRGNRDPARSYPNAREVG